jgi:hypothetical protein
VIADVSNPAITAARVALSTITAISSAIGPADLIAGAIGFVIVVVRRMRRKPSDIPEATDPRSIALKDELARLPMPEAHRKLVDYMQLALDEATESLRRMTEIAGRSRRESEERERELLQRIDQLEKRVDMLLASADEYFGRELSYLARIEDLEQQAHDAGALAARLASAQAERIAALEARLANAHADASVTLEASRVS